MPIKALKIDRVFVSAIGSHRTGTSIVQAVIALAHSLEMDVIAEGVETESQRAKLAGLGCDYAQGFLFASPLSPNDLVTYARKNLPLNTPLAA